MIKCVSDTVSSFTKADFILFSSDTQQLDSGCVSLKYQVILRLKVVKTKMLIICVSLKSFRVIKWIIWLYHQFTVYCDIWKYAANRWLVSWSITWLHMLQKGISIPTMDLHIFVIRLLKPSQISEKTYIT